MNRIVAFFLLNILIALVFVLAETLWPARKINYLKVIWPDFSSTVVGLIMKTTMVLIFIFFVYPYVHIDLPIYHWFHTKPFYFQFIFYVIAVDFGLYWVHRLMHTPYVWRTHRWHHYPAYMYWGAGLRASFIHQTFFHLVNITTLPILGPEQPLYFLLYALAAGTTANNFMHTNVVWNSRKLEWLIVTPRYHHVHHSVNYNEHNGNYGAMFSVWDHLFGTYVNPDNVKNIQFGNGDTKKHPWMFFGL